MQADSPSLPHEPQWQPGLAALGDAFVSKLPPVPVPDPRWVAHSPQAMADLGLDPAWLQGDQALQLFSGNALPSGSQTWASVYSGHQFGVWAGQLGDGRALTLGALPDAQGQLQEIQLKGSGLTPYSRRGDGRAVLRSSVREFIASEAMQALGIPTSRALCLSASPLPVYRERVEQAAIVTRFAPSFVRFGHFEHFAARQQDAELRQLADYVIDTFYPECRQAAGSPYAALLQEVTRRTATLLADWQAIGFCHGVMNTDNMSILGLTIDYGPYQFMDGFDANHICNHSDSHGRYAYGQQPDVALWNLYALGQALLPLIGEVDQAKQALDGFAQQHADALAQRMAAKLGLQADAPVRDLGQQLQQLMQAGRIDVTAFWRRLSLAVHGGAGQFDAVLALTPDRAGLQAWLDSYQTLLQQHALPDAGQQMLRSNPAVVPRNHLCQLAIERAEQGDDQGVRDLLEACTHPYETRWDGSAYAEPAPDWASQLSISCSS